ncbi:hypothetical protein AbraIFM66950_008506 [Aspergillus brasiliensis]|nr:hypothetical protein AbraIFM66950_008506 [Aspergillus brasiliensis]
MKVMSNQAIHSKGRPPREEDTHGKKVKTDAVTASPVAVLGESSETAEQQVDITSDEALTVNEIRELMAEQAIQTDVIERCIQRAQVYRDRFAETNNKGEKMLATIDFMNDIKGLDETAAAGATPTAPCICQQNLSERLYGIVGLPPQRITRKFVNTFLEGCKTEGTDAPILCDTHLSVILVAMDMTTSDVDEVLLDRLHTAIAYLLSVLLREDGEYRLFAYPEPARVFRDGMSRGVVADTFAEADRGFYRTLQHGDAITSAPTAEAPIVEAGRLRGSEFLLCAQEEPLRSGEMMAVHAFAPQSLQGKAACSLEELRRAIKNHTSLSRYTNGQLLQVRIVETWRPSRLLNPTTHIGMALTGEESWRESAIEAELCTLFKEPVEDAIIWLRDTEEKAYREFQAQ